MNEKAKTDFLEWYWEMYINPLPMTICKKNNLSDFFETVMPIFQNALIIEWLDSVEIYIEIGGADYRGIEFWYNIQERKTINGNNGEYFSTRQEATEKAIETAVNTYNNKYNENIEKQTLNK